MDGIGDNINRHNKHSRADKELTNIEDKIEARIKKEKKKLADYESFHNQSCNYLSIIVKNLSNCSS